MSDGVSGLHVGFGEPCMCLDRRGYLFVFLHVCASAIFMDVCVCVPPDLFSSTGLIRLSLTVFLTSLTWVIDWHDLHSNYLSMRSLGLAVFRWLSCGPLTEGRIIPTLLTRRHSLREERAD